MSARGVARSASRLLLLAALLASGCVTERSLRLRAIQPWPLRAGGGSGRPAIALRIYGNRSYEGALAEVSIAQLQRWRDEALLAYRQSGLFGSVSTQWDGGEELIAEIGFLMRDDAPKEGGSALGTRTTYQERDLLLRTRFRDRAGNSLGDIELSEEVRYFSYSVAAAQRDRANRVESEVMYDLNRATLRDALAKGIVQ